MKAKKTFGALCLLGSLITCNAQTSKEDSNSEKPMNLIDEQVKILNSVFELGGASENPFGGATNYSELLNKSDLDPEQKEKLREQYEIYDRSLEPKKKDSLRLKIDNMLGKEIEKSQTTIDNQ